MSTPIRGCAWPRRWPATGAPSAALRCPSGFAEVLVRAREIAPSVAAAAAACGFAESGVGYFFELFCATPNTVTAFSQGVNQSAQGTDKVSAIVNCHLVTGRIGKPGMGPFSLTGQPNAMGGREVGGLADHVLLASYICLFWSRLLARRIYFACLAQCEGLK